MRKAYLNWSSGKDSALALYRAVHSGRFSVETLFSAVNSDGEKISMHETGVDLLTKQAEAIGLPLTLFRFDPQWSREEYAAAMAAQIDKLKERGITAALFGDLYLEPLRKSREQQCEKAGIQAEFPLWNMGKDEVLAELLRLGFKAVVTCVDNQVLSDEWVGKIIDEEFIRALPADVDICGENGEYHSFVFDGPIFHYPVEFHIKGKYYREYPDGDARAAHRYWYLALE
jgi:uncharacterized protein (TIGR00290 family)